jgi:hypothetical protein
MAAGASPKAKAWPLFDHIVAKAAPSGEHSNPWMRAEDGQLRFVPDYDVLRKLLGAEFPRFRGRLLAREL